MGLLVEARRLSAMGPEGMLFTSVSGTINDGDLAVVVGPPEHRRTALLLALSGRFVVSGGSLSTNGEERSNRQAQARLRTRVAIAQAPPALSLDRTMRVADALKERRLLCGRKGMSVKCFWTAFELMGLDKPAGDYPVGELDPVEQLLLTVALAYAQVSDALAVADVDAGLCPEDRSHVRQALREITAEGKGVIASAAEGGWGDVEISLDAGCDSRESVHARTLNKSEPPESSSLTKRGRSASNKGGS